jgi:DNA recombination protein RmuC
MLTFILIGIISFALGALIVGFLVFNAQARKTHEWQTKFEVQQASAEAQKNETHNLKQQMTMQFENLAQKIFDDKSTKMTDQNYKQLSTLLDPLKERIKDFEKKVDDTYSQERYERGHLKGEISKLIELNTTMSKEAQNLVLALKGENKTQGNWGEMILENILERSGLRKGEEYLTQETYRNDQGDMLRPDVIVRLPDGKHLIVDSKMTLNAYEAYCSATDESTKEKAGLAHVESLKRHVNELSEKKYHLAEKIISPDFVILFMPLEPAFALAFQLKPDLFNQAWGKNIAIVSPTTLLATLRTVTSLWKQERQQKNALEIAKLGGGLYDKFVGVVNDIDLLGKKIKSVTETHDQLMGKISMGKGNLISQVEKLKELGVKTEKSIPQISE